MRKCCEKLKEGVMTVWAPKNAILVLRHFEQVFRNKDQNI